MLSSFWIILILAALIWELLSVFVELFVFVKYKTAGSSKIYKCTIVLKVKINFNFFGDNIEWESLYLPLYGMAIFHQIVFTYSTWNGTCSMVTAVKKLIDTNIYHPPPFLGYHWRFLRYSPKMPPVLKITDPVDPRWKSYSSKKINAAKVRNCSSLNAWWTCLRRRSFFSVSKQNSLSQNWSRSNEVDGRLAS